MDDYLPVNGEYEGWVSTLIDPDNWYNGSKLYSSILAAFGDTDIPPCVREAMDWNKTNYILTMWYTPLSEIPEPYNNSSYGDIQQVSWYYGNDGYDYNAPPWSAPVYRGKR